MVYFSKKSNKSMNGRIPVPPINATFFPSGLSSSPLPKGPSMKTGLLDSNIYLDNAFG